ncbi:MAG: cation transporter [Anaerolineales bacterium]|nr:cation transporter [Anaerolineales bacterium]
MDASTRTQGSGKMGRGKDYGQRYELATALYDGPRTAEQLSEHLRGYLKLIGLFAVYARLQSAQPREHLLTVIHAALQEMIEEGWVIRSGDQYMLTEKGREEAEKPLSEFRRTRAILARVAMPSTVSKVSLMVHLFLAAIKLPIGWISGSVGLINDGVDTLLDAFSSVLVFIGIKYQMERLANVVLVLLMLGTGSYALYEAGRRFFIPVQPEADWAAYAAILISAIFCGLLWVYQRLIGLQSGNMALITQSIDSRNHVLVAAGVTVGLIAAAFQTPLMDTIVGVFVAALILKSAVEIAFELVRNWNEEVFDLSSYKVGLLERYKTFRQDQFCAWILFSVYKGHVRTREELERSAFDSLNFEANRSLQELGLSGRTNLEALAARAIGLVFSRGWLEGDEGICLTEAGFEHLSTAMRGIWLRPYSPSPEKMRADTAHFLGRVAHEGHGPQRRFRRGQLSSETEPRLTDED